jgi:hypothetical protein
MLFPIDPDQGSRGARMRNFQFMTNVSWVLAMCIVTSSATSAAAADGWDVSRGLPGSDVCVASRTGGEVDAMLMLNRRGQLLLVVGRQDWHKPTGIQDVGLQVDGFAIAHVNATVFDNLVFVLIEDDALVKRLRAAKTVTWYLPWGQYQASVAGLTEAWDWVRGCERAKQNAGR